MSMTCILTFSLPSYKTGQWDHFVAEHPSSLFHAIDIFFCSQFASVVSLSLSTVQDSGRS
jgi:hypothetical protein